MRIFIEALSLVEVTDMRNILITLFLNTVLFLSNCANAESIIFRSQDYNPIPVFSNVPNFFIHIETQEELSPGVYFNPELEFVNYTVSGSLSAGTPSGFPSFNLMRNISGDEFYQQGSSISFEIATDANLEDGLQLNELVDTGTIFVFNGREIDNGRFHPALLELYADETGRIQNSNNTPSLNPLLEVNFGDEYITDLSFAADTTSIFVVQPEPQPNSNSGGGSLVGIVLMSVLMLSRQSRLKCVESAI